MFYLMDGSGACYKPIKFVDCQAKTKNNVVEIYVLMTGLITKQASVGIQ